MSAQRRASVLVSPEKGDTHIYFTKPVASSPRKELQIKLQTLHRNSGAGLPKKNLQCERNDVMIMAGMALSNAS